MLRAILQDDHHNLPQYRKRERGGDEGEERARMTERVRPKGIGVI